ncbi:glucan endo-1,3-beta-glucosidase-like [Durio zibethinus]|uniref:glucan endo-1,3-beta-D-glucosidase n=1 Tax=Durio zibethinus TaxID=66656 RepID=A0A6P6AIB3_DURZI|nr:glucan endo-1,3-beta-glucosidase-like [Durio zibethinus]
MTLFTNNHSFHHLFLFLLLITFLHLFSSTAALGVNYGMIADNLPSPTEVANFIKTQTIFDSVKIFDSNPDVLRAFANTNISVSVTVANGEIPSLTTVRAARRWVNAHIRPFHPQTKIKYIIVGNEVLLLNNLAEINNLLPAMKCLNRALHNSQIQDIKVTSAHALNIFNGLTVPSLARFRIDYAKSFFAPLLLFHRRTKSPFMINPYPYFELNAIGNKLDFALFKRNPGLFDGHSGKTYTNAFDALLDKTFSAMSAIGCGDVEIVIGETGWPSQGDGGNLVATIDNALSYNGNLVREILSGNGTPLMPNRTFETYIFGLFNENQKPGPLAEKNWGLFRPDFTPVYNAGVLRNGRPVPTPTQPQPTPSPATPVPSGKRFCVPKPGVTDAQLQSNLDYACSQGTNCSPIQPGGPCAEPPTTRSRATFAMNSFYRSKGEVDSACDFSGTAQITTVNPSYGNCHYV